MERGKIEFTKTNDPYMTAWINNTIKSMDSDFLLSDQSPAPDQRQELKGLPKSMESDLEMTGQTG